MPAMGEEWLNQVIKRLRSNGHARTRELAQKGLMGVGAPLLHGVVTIAN